MKYKELKKDFYWAGILDKDLRVFDIIMKQSLEQLITLMY